MQLQGGEGIGAELALCALAYLVALPLLGSVAATLA